MLFSFDGSSKHFLGRKPSHGIFFSLHLSNQTLRKRPSQTGAVRAKNHEPRSSRALVLGLLAVISIASAPPIRKVEKEGKGTHWFFFLPRSSLACMYNATTRLGPSVRLVCILPPLYRPTKEEKTHQKGPQSLPMHTGDQFISAKNTFGCWEQRASKRDPLPQQKGEKAAMATYTREGERGKGGNAGGD